MYSLLDDVILSLHDTFHIYPCNNYLLLSMVSILNRQIFLFRKPNDVAYSTAWSNNTPHCIHYTWWWWHLKACSFESERLWILIGMNQWMSSPRLSIPIPPCSFFPKVKKVMSLAVFRNLNHCIFGAHPISPLSFEKSVRNLIYLEISLTDRLTDKLKQEHNLINSTV